MNIGNKGPAGGGSGDITALHGGKVGDLSKVSAVLAKNADKNNHNSLKTVEVI